MQKKLLLKVAREQKNFARVEKIFLHIKFSLSQKQWHEQKPLSFHSALHCCSTPKSLQIFSRVSCPASKITPRKLILKKDFPNTPFRVVRQRPNTNSFSSRTNFLNCRKPRAPQYSSAHFTAIIKNEEIAKHISYAYRTPGHNSRVLRSYCPCRLH